jgi:hypothetical protein
MLLYYPQYRGSYKRVSMNTDDNAQVGYV